MIGIREDERIDTCRHAVRQAQEENRRPDIWSGDVQLLLDIIDRLRRRVAELETEARS